MYDHYYLAHFGIKGQMWGRRRYRNPDGTLTEEGKKRYRYGEYKSVREMTDEELSSYVKRLTQEQEYTRMMNKMHPSLKKKAVSFTSKLLGDLLSKVTTASVNAIANKMNQAFSEESNPNANSGGKKGKKGKKDNNGGSSSKEKTYLEYLNEEKQVLALEKQIRALEKERKAANKEKRDEAVAKVKKVLNKVIKK